MDDAERAFRDALHRVDSVKIPVPTLEPAEVRRTPGLGVAMSRWLAAAAVVAVVAGIGIWVVAGRGQTMAGVPAAPSSAPAPVTLTGTTWIAVEFYGQPTVYAPDKMPFVEFRPDSTFGGADPCNGIGGTYRLIGTALTITRTGASTLIGCNPTQQENFLNVLAGTRHVHRVGDTIELVDQQGNTLARFRSSDAYTQPTPTPTLPTASLGPKPQTATPTASLVAIRVRNASDVDFESVEIAFSGNHMTFGPIAAGKATRFVKTDTANYFAPITVVTADTTIVMTHEPSGGAPLEPRRYTYDLNIVGGELKLTITNER